MTSIQKEVIRKLFELSYDNGFHSFPLSMLTDKHTPTELFDKSTESGLLYEIAQHGKGYLNIRNDAASINFDLKDQLERWSK